MNRCDYYQELISRMLDGELSQQESQDLAEHLESCSECSLVYSAFSALSETMGEDLDEAPESLHLNVMAELRRQEIIKKNKKARRIKHLLAAAACLVLVVAAGSYTLPKLSADSAMVSSDAVSLDAAPAEAAAPELFRITPDSMDVLPAPAAEEAAFAEPTEAEQSEDAAANEAAAVQEDISESQADTAVTSYTDSIIVWLAQADMALLMDMLAGEELESFLTEADCPTYIVSSDNAIINVYFIDENIYYLDDISGKFYISVCSQTELENFFSNR